tara:strand:+ start:314 stop:652 length:339 start_codon:yes stop_codon:yes gene_type:complete
MGGIIKSSLRKMAARIHLMHSAMTASLGTGQILWLIRDSTQPEHPLIDVLEWAAKDRGFNMKRIYKNWPVHNLIAHPVMELLYILSLGRLENFGNMIHDATLPDHTHGQGRG